MLGHTYQESLVLIGSKNGSTRNSVPLTVAYTGNNKRFNTSGLTKINFNVLYTTGAVDTNTALQLMIEASPDGVHFYQIPNESITTGTSTLTRREFHFASPDESTAYSFSFPLDIQDKFMRISAKQSGVATNFGTIYVEGTISGGK